MQDRQETLRQYTNDMLALSRHIHRATVRQVDDATVIRMPEVFKLIETIEHTMRQQIETLEEHLEKFNDSFFDDVKSTLAEWLGAVAGIYDAIRPNTVSRMLRDDYTALGLAAISYTMLHTTGLALQNENPDDMLAHDTAGIAQRHLDELTPLIVQISKVIPIAVNRELLEDTNAVDLNVADKAIATTQQAWNSETADSYTPVRER